MSCNIGCLISVCITQYKLLWNSSAELWNQLGFLFNKVQVMSIIMLFCSLILSRRSHLNNVVSPGRFWNGSKLALVLWRRWRAVHFELHVRKFHHTNNTYLHLHFLHCHRNLSVLKQSHTKIFQTIQKVFYPLFYQPRFTSSIVGTQYIK